MLDIPCRPWKCTSKNPIHRYPQKVDREPAFLVLQILSSASLAPVDLAPKSNRIDDLQTNAWNPKIGD